MERYPNPTPESSKEDTDSESDSDKKKKKRSVSLPNLRTPEEPAKEPSRSSSAGKEPENPWWRQLEEIKKESPAEQPTASKTEINLPSDSAEEVESLGNLTTEERQAVAAHYVETALPEVTEEAQEAEADSPQELAATAHQAMLENLQQQLEAGVDPELAQEQAYAAVAHELGGDPDDMAPEELPEVDAAIGGETILAEEPPEEKPVVASKPPIIPPENGAPFNAEYVEPDPDDSDPMFHSNSQNSNVPPVPPQPSFTPSGSGNNLPPASRNAHFGSPNTAPQPATANTITQAESLAAERQAQARGLLVGGVIGYLIGRRRGRIKTEKKLIPIQKKLEKQVTILHEEISVKEEQIRKLATRKASAAKQPGQIHRMAEQLRGTATKLPPQTELTTQALPDVNVKSTVESSLQRGSVSAESSVPVKEKTFKLPTEDFPLATAVLAESPTLHEALKASVPRSVQAEKAQVFDPISSEKLEKIASPAPSKKVEQLNRAEVLELAKNIAVDDGTLKEAYENHQIDERGLRRVVEAHLHHDNVKEVLTRERVEKQLSFERDPLQRQTSLSTSGSATDSRFIQQPNSGVDPQNFMTKPIQTPTQMRAQNDKHQSATKTKTGLILAAVIALIILAWLTV